MHSKRLIQRNRAWLRRELRDLREQECATEPSPDQFEAMAIKLCNRGFDPEEEAPSLLEFLAEHQRALLTELGEEMARFEAEQSRKTAQEQERQRREWCQTNRMGEFSPNVGTDSLTIPPRGPTEPLATEKQVTYLKGLGVKDAAWLLGLGKKQASAAIDQILQTQVEIRDEVEAVRDSIAAKPATRPTYFNALPKEKPSFWQQVRNFLG